MPSQSEPKKDSQRVAFQCSCGKRLTALSSHAGKRLTCPGCRQPIAVPGSLPPVLPKLPQNAEVEPQKAGNHSFIALWSFIGVFLIACTLFIVWYTYSTNQAKIAAADKRIFDATIAANKWTSGMSPQDGEEIERQLTDFLGDKNASKKDDGIKALNRLKEQLDQLGSPARIERAKREATALFEEVQKSLKSQEFDKLVGLLEKLVANPHATERAVAAHLLIETKTAASDTETFNALVSLPAQDFNRVRETYQINDGKVTDQALSNLRIESVKRNIEKAAQKRSEIAIEEKRRRDAEQEKIAEEKRQRELSESKLAAIRDPASVSFKDLLNFPEEYSGKYVKLNSVWFHGDLTRMRELGIFGVGVNSDDGKYVSGIVVKKKLAFVVTEEFGRSIDVIFAADKKVKTNLFCEIVKLNDYLLARIYRIETLSIAGNVLHTYDDKGVLESIKSSQHPQPLTQKGTREKPIVANFTDLLNFPEDYAGCFTRLNSVWLHGDFERKKEEGIFSVGVSSDDGKYASKSFYGSELKFVVSEGFGRRLDVNFQADKKVATILYCEISKIKNTPVAMIYRIETLSLTDKVLNTFEDN